MHIDIQPIGKIGASLRAKASSWESLLKKAGEELDDTSDTKNIRNWTA
ncbi:MAG: hypothetical protein ACMUIP_10600 [bacterium]